MPTIAVIDTGICNLRSVTKALEAVGATPRVVRSRAELSAANSQGLVLPGVGALRDCVASLQATEMDRAVRDWIDRDDPFLGVCLGMQALFEHSEEGDVTGLGIFPGKVVKFRLKAPLKASRARCPLRSSCSMPAVHSATMSCSSETARSARIGGR